MDQEFNKQRVMGEYYGYPQCCVDEWCASHPLFFSERPDVQQMASQEGFVPCIKHSEEIMEGKTKVEDLIQNRICPLPFPEQTSDIQVGNYLAKYVKKHTKNVKPKRRHDLG